jgi:hypothetical protein
MRNREAYLQRRKELKELSKLAKARIETDCEGMTVNEVLINEFYTSNEHQEFNTLFEWNNKGYKVKKGSQSFCVWGSPKTRNSEKEAEKNNSEEEETEFYPLCYLFSNAQVEKR